jgi:XRE family transcriptional regulator, fatty acid utilization regulator
VQRLIECDNMSLMNPSTVGQRLRIAREASGLTQADVARAIGTSVSAISMIESGRRDPRGSTLVKIMGVVGLTVVPLQPATPLTIRQVVERAERGRQAIERAGLEASDPEARLERKRLRGIDVSVEEQLLAERS